jgi:hypothetical protein
MHSLARNLINPTGYTSIDVLGIPRKILRLLSVFFTPYGRKKYRPDVGIFRIKKIFFNVARSLSTHWSCSGFGVHPTIIMGIRM